MAQDRKSSSSVLQKDLGSLLFGAVPKPAREACWCLLLWGILMCGIAFPLLADTATSTNPKLHDARRIAFLLFTAYVGVAAVSSAFLLWQRKSWARILAWTCMPLTLLCIPVGTVLGIKTIIAMHSREMSAYLGAEPSHGFEVIHNDKPR